MVSERQRDGVEAFVARGRAEGAELVVGGERPDRRGFYVAPTLFAGARSDMFVAREEAFGPVVVAMEFDDEADAISKANDSPYGLFSYVFTGDQARGVEVAKRIRSGMVGVNDVQPHHDRAVRRVQAVRRRPGPRGLRARGVQRAPGHHLGVVTAHGIAAQGPSGPRSGKEQGAWC